jgi:hypothetical protein
MTFNGKKFIPVEGDENKGFYRDMQSNAIVYKDQDEYAKYMQSYNERQRKKQEFTTLQDEVNDLKSDVSDIKKLLIDFIKENK